MGVTELSRRDLIIAFRTPDEAGARAKNDGSDGRHRLMAPQGNKTTANAIRDSLHFVCFKHLRLDVCWLSAELPDLEFDPAIVL